MKSFMDKLNNLFEGEPTADEKDLILQLHRKGYTHVELAQSLHRHRKIMKVTTTPERCLRDIECILLEEYRQKVV